MLEVARVRGGVRERAVEAVLVHHGCSSGVTGPIGSVWAMDWQLHDTAARPRVLVMP